MHINPIQSTQLNNYSNKAFKARFYYNAQFAKLWSQQSLTQSLVVDTRKFAEKNKNHLLEVINTTEENGFITSFTIFNRNTGKVKTIKNTWWATPNDILSNFFNRALKSEFEDLFDEKDQSAELYNLITKK